MAFDSVKTKAVADARKILAKQLNIAEAALTQEEQAAIVSAVDKQVKSQITNRAVNSAAAAAINKNALGPALSELVLVQTATAAIPDLEVALQKNAELLFKTFQAFKGAGFTDEQSFQLILSQMQRR